MMLTGISFLLFMVRSFEVKIVKSYQLLKIKLSAPSLSSIMELQPPPPLLYTAQVVLNASVAHPR